MKMTFTNNVPVSAFAATGVLTVAPRFAVDGGSPAVISPLMAPLSLTHEATILPTVQDPAVAKRGYLGQETKPSTLSNRFAGGKAIGGSALKNRRGVPPRSRPV